MRTHPAPAFSRAVILGDSLTAKLAALVLAARMPIEAMVGPALDTPVLADPENLVGKAAHSHIFMPRFGDELHRAAPAVWDALVKEGLTYSPGSTRLQKGDVPGATRLFSTRWQLDEAIDRVFRAQIKTTTHARTVTGSISVSDSRGAALEAVVLSDGSKLIIEPGTLVVDAMGADTPICQAFLAKQSDHIDHVGHVSYVTQFFQLTDADSSKLPDPLTECSQGFGESHVMLYPGIGRWFSISTAIGNDNKALLTRLRDQKAFLEYCQQSVAVAAWIGAATPMGTPKLFLKPRNRWRVAAFSNGAMPENYVAVGDALATTLPTLGAGCSFAAMHLRVLAETVSLGGGAFHVPFARAIRSEQFPFFLQSMAPDMPAHGFVAPRQSRSKRMRVAIRRLLGVDRIRIRKDLVRTSSLTHKK